MGSPLPLTRVQEKVSLAPYNTLRSGGAAQWFLKVRSVEEFAAVAIEAQQQGIATTVLGWGSNVLPSDDGVPGLTILNSARQIEFGPDGAVSADCGCGFQELFLKTAQHGLLGLEFAVGIPGTLGGALVSNAGAYRSNVSEFLTELEVIHNGERKMVPPSFMMPAVRIGSRIM